jgi:hypothetical protein
MYRFINVVGAMDDRSKKDGRNCCKWENPDKRGDVEKVDRESSELGGW